MRELTQEEVLRRGAAASALLQDPTFNMFFEELTQATLESIGNTYPSDSELRENLYFQLNGLRDLLATMQSTVDAALAIQTAKETEESNK